MRLTPAEEDIAQELEQKGLVKNSEDGVKLTPYGEVIMVMGYETVKRTEKMDRNRTGLSSDSEDADHSKLVLVIMFAVFLFVLLLILWRYYEDLFHL